MDIYFTIIVLMIALASNLIAPCQSEGCDTADGWVAFENTKCFKLFDEFVTRDQAHLRCLESGNPDELPSLPVIKSEEEQAFITNYVYSDMNIVDGMWIGLKRVFNGVNNETVWDDGSAITYTNWAEGFPEDPSRVECFKMASQFSKSRVARSNGEWMDAQCGSRNVVLCQKLQDWTIIDLRRELVKLREDSVEALKQESIKLREESAEALRQESSKLKEEYAEALRQESLRLQSQLEVVKQGSVPIGFLYIELPGHPNPKTLWPYADWQDISSQFAGQFFRVFGGGSGAWGSVQEECYSRINEMLFANGPYHPMPLLLPIEGAAGPVTAGYYEGDEYGGNQFLNLFLHVRYCENRPKNSAIRIWKRTR